MRERLPDERKSLTHTFKLGGNPLHVVVGMYDDGRPGEIMAFDLRMGSFEHAMMDAAFEMISVGLQYGIPLEVFVNKLIGKRFPPDGFTSDKAFPMCSSVLDLVAQWLKRTFLSN